MAKAIDPIKLPISDVMGKCTLRVRVSGLRSLRIRIRIGVAVMTLGAWITGANVEFEDYWAL